MIASEVARHRWCAEYSSTAAERPPRPAAVLSGGPRRIRGRPLALSYRKPWEALEAGVIENTLPEEELKPSFGRAGGLLCGWRLKALVKAAFRTLGEAGFYQPDIALRRECMP